METKSLKLRTFKAPRADIHLIEGGSGPDLLFLHGAGGITADNPFLAALAEKYHVYAPLLPGYGESEECENIRTMLDFTLHCHDIMVALGLDIKWPKIRGGTEFQWGGYWICERSARLGIAESRRQWAVKGLIDLIAGSDTTAGLESGLGRLSFVGCAIIFDRPRLAPLFSYAAAMRRRKGQMAST